MELHVAPAARRAVEACRAAVHHPEAHLRIHRGERGYALDLVAGPVPGDTEVDAGDFSIFVESGLAPELHGGRLLHRDDGTGAAFEVVPAPPGHRESGVEGSGGPHRGRGTATDPSVPARVREVLERVVNPFLEGHGGRVVLREVLDGVARVEMEGGCQGCAAARITLTDVVERMLRADVPELAGVEDVTDHDAGTDPWLPRRSPVAVCGTPPAGTSGGGKRRIDLAVASGRATASASPGNDLHLAEGAA